jgi:Golgi phosphoprotein 3
MFTLYEELFMLSIHAEKGTFIGSSIEQMKPGLAGAILAELAMLGKIQTSNNHRLKLVDDSPTSVEVLDEALTVLKESEKERKFGYWINPLSQRKDEFRKLIVESLIQKGIVTQEDDRLVWVIPSPLHAEINASTKYWVNEQLRRVVLTSEEIQPRDIVLLSLLRACGLLELVFLRDERRLASRKINQLFYNQALTDPILQTIQEIESAIVELVEED